MEFDRVNKAKHYNVHPSGIEVKEVTNYLCFNLGNAFKYVTRYDVDDQHGAHRSLRSAVWYLREYDQHKAVSPRPDEAYQRWVAQKVGQFAQTDPDPIRSLFYSKFQLIVLYPMDQLALEATVHQVEQLIAQMETRRAAG